VSREVAALPVLDQGIDRPTRGQFSSSRLWFCEEVILIREGTPSLRVAIVVVGRVERACLFRRCYVGVVGDVGR
jgi:hypothetical protein